MSNPVHKKIICPLFLAGLVVFITVTSTGLTNLAQAQESKSWTITFPHSGIYSSPRVADLNLDGTEDIIIGTGKMEFEKTDSAVVAIDGITRISTEIELSKPVQWGAYMGSDYTGIFRE